MPERQIKIIPALSKAERTKKTVAWMNPAESADGRRKSTAPDIAYFGVMNESAYTRRVMLKKVDENNVALEGARFRIFRADGSEVKDGMESGKTDYESGRSGVYFIGELPYGTYYLVEVQAPTGYTKKDFVLTVNGDTPLIMPSAPAENSAEEAAITKIRTDYSIS